MHRSGGISAACVVDLPPSLRLGVRCSLSNTKRLSRIGQYPTIDPDDSWNSPDPLAVVTLWARIEAIMSDRSQSNNYLHAPMILIS